VLGIICAAAAFDPLRDTVKHLDALGRVLADGSFAAEHDGVGLLENGIGHVGDFCASGHGRFDHALKHVSGDNDWPAEVLASLYYAALDDIGAPRSALPFILDGLANSDARSLHLYAGAARAAAALGPEADEAVPHLMRAFEPGFRDHPLSFESYFAAFSPKNLTSPRVEAVRALGQLGPRALIAVPILRAVATHNEEQEDEPYSPSLGREARRALLSLENR
jgi:hypothetical protein